jgi:SAM-dependent methyltransferase
MSRKERRAAIAASKGRRETPPSDISSLLAVATRAYENGRLEEAEIVTKKILVGTPSHRQSLMLLGAVYQASQRHRLAIKQFLAALASDSLDPISHYNIACSFQILGEFQAARNHFAKATQLGIGVEELIAHNPTVLTCIRRITEPSLTSARKPIDLGEVTSLADDLFLQCALSLVLFRSVELELFLTELRYVLLRLVVSAPTAITENIARLSCALAQQCFINEYVFALKPDESNLAEQMRNLVLQRSAAGEKVSVPDLAVVAAYFPLHRLPGAEKLGLRKWPEWAANLIRQQIDEPLEEKRDWQNIPALTSIDDGTSVAVMRQYEENPYPRWTINRIAAMTDEDKRREGRLHSGKNLPNEILIAGCGSGQHACEMAQYFPDARILAIDLSRASLAYARRKAREQKLRNIEWAHADILKLDKLNASFDRIECVGVLHHLADPIAGWRVLLKLLKSNGIMRLGLYAELARRSVTQARELAALRGLGIEDIRQFRQILIRDSNAKRWDSLFSGIDFYSMSGCRDLIFNVMEHRFTIPDIATFLAEHRLSFLGFELPDRVMGEFCRQHGAADTALDLKTLDLKTWHDFERSNPNAFHPMYVFSITKQ